MKKYFLIIAVVFLLSASFVYGQSLFIGGSIGLNLSKLDYNSDIISDGYNINFRNGIKAGLFIEYPITNQFIISTELNYSMRGAEHNSNGVFWPLNYKFITKMDYLEIPITLQYRMPLGINISPKIFAGAEAAFLLQAKTEYYENDILQMEVNSNSQSNEYGVIFGIGADYNLSTNKIIFDIRYYYGISNIDKNESSKTTNKTISFNIGYAFSLE